MFVLYFCSCCGGFWWIWLFVGWCLVIPMVELFFSSARSIFCCSFFLGCIFVLWFGCSCYQLLLVCFCQSVTIPDGSSDSGRFQAVVVLLCCFGLIWFVQFGLFFRWFWVVCLWCTLGVYGSEFVFLFGPLAFLVIPFAH